MKLAIYLTKEGQTRYVKGSQLYSWDFFVRVQEEGETAAGTYGTSVLLGVEEFKELNKDSLIPGLLAELDKRVEEIKAEAGEQLLKVQQERNDLTMLTFEGE